MVCWALLPPPWVGKEPTLSAAPTCDGNGRCDSMRLHTEDRNRMGLLQGGACLGGRKALGSACAFAQEVSLGGPLGAGMLPGSRSCSLRRDGEPGCGDHGAFLEEAGLQQSAHLPHQRCWAHSVPPCDLCCPLSPLKDTATQLGATDFCCSRCDLSVMMYKGKLIYGDLKRVPLMPCVYLSEPDLSVLSVSFCVLRMT